MKKILLLILSVMLTSGIYAQKHEVAYGGQEFLDNTYIGVYGGAMTPLTFNSVFPLNGEAGINAGKLFSPVYGIEGESTALFGSSHGPGRFDTGTGHNIIRSLYTGLAGTVNMSNLLYGYKGKPRFFEAGIVAGIGWIHTYNANVKDRNYFGAKTAVRGMFNISDRSQLTVEPGIYWNLTGQDNGVRFDKRGAQLAVSVGYIYKFKTSNGTHNFKVYDITALNADINGLEAQVAKLKARKPVTVTNTVEKMVEKVVNTGTYVFFAKNSSELTETAKAALDKVSGKVNVTASASPEGTDAYNKALSEKRADAVAAYLKANGVTVCSVKGIGNTGSDSGRVAVVSAE